MIKIIISIWLLLISTLLVFSQPKSEVVVNNKLNKSVNDTIQYLNIPIRSDNAIEGSEFVNQVSALSLEDRERAVVKEILAGNVPSFSRKLRPITINRIINNDNYELTLFTVCDYMAIGSDDDYLYIPMTPSTAQYLAARLECSLPTRKIVNVIYKNAEIKLHPQPIPPSDKMTTIPVFKNHTDSIKQQILQLGFDRAGNYIIAGHKKDIVISIKIYSSDRNYDRVVIYGWHLSVNDPIQPLYNGHIAAYADYSHGVRLISNNAILNGDSIKIDNILKDPTLAVLLSDEGVISKPYYPESDIFTSVGYLQNQTHSDFILRQNYPNPFNPATTIKYSILGRSVIARSETKWQSNSEITSSSQQDGIPRNDEVNLTLKVYDVLGREVTTLVNEKQRPGNYEVTFNAVSINRPISSGVYFYTLRTDFLEQSRKMILLR